VEDEATECLQRSHSVVVIVIPAPKAVTLFLRTLLVSSMLHSIRFPLAAREKQNVARLLGRQCTAHLQRTCYNIVLRHTPHTGSWGSRST